MLRSHDEGDNQDAADVLPELGQGELQLQHLRCPRTRLQWRGGGRQWDCHVGVRLAGKMHHHQHEVRTFFWQYSSSTIWQYASVECSASVLLSTILKWWLFPVCWSGFALSPYPRLLRGLELPTLQAQHVGVQVWRDPVRHQVTSCSVVLYTNIGDIL